MLVLFFLPVYSHADGSAEAPLSLLNSPHKNSQTGQSPTSTHTIGELHDIYGPVPIADPPPYLLIAGIVLLVSAGSRLILLAVQKKAQPAPPPIPPWQRALQDLADARKLLNPERGLLYMDRVSQILRSYIQSRFAIHSTRQTTREFLNGLTRIDGSSPLQTYKSELQDCLEQADMAKFAHHLPSLGNLEQMEVAVTTFIKKTEPAEPQQPTKKAKRGRS